ncbi:restriction endonuclease, partial [Microtetraspora sp. AC03309]|uniref:BREX-1 system adenine-specific DNA-methyltransferase PglX n=1 Tax=Microtetraspora sp. AC03309 TaxID=2779376 RepID=UPI001E59C441
MLTYAFDLLYAIYEEEGYAPAEIPSLILSNNLYGTEIDPRAGALSAFALTMKAAAKRRLFLKDAVKPNICLLEPISFSPGELAYLVTEDGDLHQEEAFWNQFSKADFLGALIQPDATLISRLTLHLDRLKDGGDIFKADAIGRAWRVVQQAEYLAERYSVVVANPPYMGGKNMGSDLTEFAKLEFPDTKSDLFAMFIDRCGSLVDGHGGLVAMITMQSWMFLTSFEDLRGRIIRSSPPVCMAHLGERA